MFTRHLSVSSMFDSLPLSCFDFDQLMVLKTGVCVCGGGGGGSEGVVQCSAGTKLQTKAERSLGVIVSGPCGRSPRVSTSGARANCYSKSGLLKAVAAGKTKLSRARTFACASVSVSGRVQMKQSQRPVQPGPLQCNLFLSSVPQAGGTL